MTQTLAIPLFPKFVRSLYYEKVKMTSMEKKLKNKIEKMVNSVIKTRRPLRKSINNLLSEIFDLKIRLFKWVIREELDLQNISQELLIELEKARSKIKTKEEMVLFENTLFSLKTTLKVLRSILNQYPLSEQKLEETEIDISYEQVKVAIKMEPLPEETKHSISRLADVTLLLEFAIILAILFIFKIRKFSKKRVIELSRLLRNWTQEYGALAIELQLWKPNIEKIISKEPSYSISQEIIDEEKQLADSGISDYLKQIINEEENE